MKTMEVLSSPSHSRYKYYQNFSENIQYQQVRGILCCLVVDSFSSPKVIQVNEVEVG